MVTCFQYIHLLAIKKLKHKLVEKLNEETADSLGISRAILIHGMYHNNHVSVCLSVQVTNVGIILIENVTIAES